MLLKNFDIEKEEYLNKLKVIGTFAADDLNYKYKLSKYHIYLPFIFQKFIVRLGV